MRKVAVVTGAASGIGKALAEALVTRGDHVVLADVDPAVELVAKEVAAQGPGTTESAQLDVRDAEAVRVLVEDTSDRHGRIDLMFNNAGVGVGGEVDELSLQHWDRAIDVNVRGVIHGVHAVYPLMLAQGFGHIVNTASVAGLMPSPLLAPYSMSKHAVVGLSLSLRDEAAARGVKVSVVCPGVIETPILDKGNPADLPALRQDLSGREYLERFNRPYPARALAADVLHGVERNRPIIVSPRTTRVQWWLYRAAPGLVERSSLRLVRWARQTLEDRPAPSRL